MTVHLVVNSEILQMPHSLTVNADASTDGTGALVKHVFAVDTMGVTNKVRLRLKIDPVDGSVIHREVDLDVNWDEINALEARMLASRDA